MILQLETLSGHLILNLDKVFYITVAPHPSEEGQSLLEIMSINGNRHSPIVRASPEDILDVLREHYGNTVVDSTSAGPGAAYGDSLPSVFDSE